MNSKTSAIALTAISSVWIIAVVRTAIIADYEYTKTIGSYWSLADKSSDMKSKSEHIDMFVQSLESSGLQGTHNAVFLPSRDNSFDANLEALKTLQYRLREVQDMDVNSLAYQQAIAQITSQEQGGAEDMLGVFQGCWTLKNHPMIWQWYGVLNVSLLIVAIIACIVFWVRAWEDSW